MAQKNRDVENLISYQKQLEVERATTENILRLIRETIHPDGPPFNGWVNQGDIDRRAILNNTAEEASNTLATATYGILINPRDRWFELRAPAGSRIANRRDVKLWLHDATTACMQVFLSPQSNFGACSHLVFREAADYGTGIGYVKDRPGQVPRFLPRSLPQTYLDDNSDDLIDTVCRRWPMTARKAHDWWGDKVGPSVTKAANSADRKNQEFWFQQWTMPRGEQVGGLQTRSRMPFATYVLNETDKLMVQRGGTRSFRWLTPRWMVARPQEKYGRGPGWQALPDVRSLQRSERLGLRGGEKRIDPPLVTGDKTAIGNLETDPYGTIVVKQHLFNQRHFPVQALDYNSDIGIAIEFIQHFEEHIRVAYLNHILRISRDPRMSATQVIEITEEMRRDLGPHTQNLQDEYLGPAIANVLEILIFDGVIDPPPEDLFVLQVEYMNPMARAQRLSEASSVVNNYMMTESIRAIEPGADDNVDHDLAYRYISERNLPPHLIRPMRDVKRDRAARNELAQQQAAIAAVGELAPAAQNLGQASAAFAKAEQPEMTDAA